MIKARKIPMRMCVGCRAKKAKNELIRIVRTPSNEILIDGRGKISGRGAYICSDVECLNKAIKSRALSRMLQSEIGEGIIEGLKEQLQNGC